MVKAPMYNGKKIVRQGNFGPWRLSLISTTKRRLRRRTHNMDPKD
jgi:hypothetical protein